MHRGQVPTVPTRHQVLENRCAQVFTKRVHDQTSLLVCSGKQWFDFGVVMVPFHALIHTLVCAQASTNHHVNAQRTLSMYIYIYIHVHINMYIYIYIYIYEREGER